MNAARIRFAELRPFADAAAARKIAKDIDQNAALFA